MTRAEKLAKVFHNQCLQEKTPCIVAYTRGENTSVGASGKSADVIAIIATCIEHIAQGDKESALEVIAAIGAFIAKDGNDKKHKAFDKIFKLLNEV